MSSEQQIEQAFAQNKGKEKSGPNLVPTGDYVGTQDTEISRVMGLMRGRVPEDEQRGREEPVREVPDIPADTPAGPDAGPTPQSGTEEDRISLADFFEEESQGQDESTLSGNEEAEGGQTIKIGDREVPLSTVEEWEDSYNNSSKLVESQKQSEKDKELWRESLLSLRDDPVEGLKALGLTPEQIARKVQEAGIVSTTNNTNTNEDSFFDDDGDLALESESSSALKRLAAQNRQMQKQLQDVAAQNQELMERVHRETLSKREQEIMEATNQRLDDVRGYLGNVVNRASDLDAREKKLLMRATMTDVESHFTEAPQDIAGLREWAKGRLKAALEEASVDLESAANKPKGSPIPTRVGETPKGENSESSWDQVNPVDDDSRKKGAIAWLEHFSGKS